MFPPAGYGPTILWIWQNINQFIDLSFDTKSWQNVIHRFFFIFYFLMFYFQSSFGKGNYYKGLIPSSMDVMRLFKSELLLKFIYSKKATKFCEIFNLLFTVCTTSEDFAKFCGPAFQSIWTLNLAFKRLFSFMNLNWDSAL